jgi:predicted transcriptional regulator
MRSSAEILHSVPDLSAAERHRFLESIDREARNMTDLARTLIDYFDRSTVTARTVSPAREVDDLIIGENNYFPELEEAAESLHAEIAAEDDGHYGEAALHRMLARRFAIRVDSDATARPGPGGFAARYGFDAEQRVMWFHAPVAAPTRRFQLARLLAELVHADTIARHAGDARLTSPAARRLAYRALAAYVAGAMTLPYSRFLADAEAHHYDIDRLKQIHTASFEQVAHRLVTLRRPGEQGIPFGFLRSDPAGRLTKHFPLPGLPLSTSGHACPLWALYVAFRSAGRIVRQIATFPDGARYLFVARTVSKHLAAYREPPFHSAVMLACDVLHADRTVYGRGLNLNEPTLAVPVGPTCRLCVRRDCAHRQEEIADAAGGDPTLRLPLVPREFAPPPPT